MSWLIPESIQSLFRKLSEYSQYYLSPSPVLSEKMAGVIQKHLEVLQQLNHDRDLHLLDLRNVIQDCEKDLLKSPQIPYLIPRVVKGDFIRGIDDLEVLAFGLSYKFLGIPPQGEKSLEEAPQVIEHILKIAQFTDRFAEKRKLTFESKLALFRNLLFLQSQTIVNRGPGAFRGLMNVTMPSVQLDPLHSNKKVTWDEDGYFEVRVFYTFTVSQRKQHPVHEFEPIGLLSLVTDFKLCPQEDRWEWTSPNFCPEKNHIPL